MNRRYISSLLMTLILTIPIVHAADLPKEVTLMCDDNESVMIHIGKDGDMGLIYMRIGPAGAGARFLPLTDYYFPKYKVISMIFENKTDGVRKMLLAEGSYYKADSKTNKWMGCNITNAIY